MILIYKLLVSCTSLISTFSIIHTWTLSTIFPQQGKCASALQNSDNAFEL